jgi:NhaA family Na+:H+ antiporter
MFGVSLLGGIGFTMSIFICNLSFTNEDFINLGKLSIFLSSAIAAIAGLMYLYLNSKRNLKNRVNS